MTASVLSLAIRRGVGPALAALAVCFVCLSGCGETAAPEGTTTPAVDPKEQAALDALFGERVLNIIKSADTLVVHRLAQPEDLTDTRPRALSEIKPLTGSVLATPEQRDEIRRLLLDPRQYLWEVTKECTDFPLARFEFSRGKETADVLVRGYCWFVQVYENGQLVREKDFDKGMPKVIRVLRQLFPQDPEIGALQ